MFIQRFVWWDQHCFTTNLFSIRFLLLWGGRKKVSKQARTKERQTSRNRKKGWEGETWIHRSFLVLKFIDSFFNNSIQPIFIKYLIQLSHSSRCYGNIKMRKMCSLTSRNSEYRRYDIRVYHY